MALPMAVSLVAGGASANIVPALTNTGISQSACMSEVTIVPARFAGRASTGVSTPAGGEAVAVPVAVPVAARVVVTGAVIVAVLKIAPPFTTSHQSPGGSQKLRFASCVWLFTWWWVPSGESESYKSVTVWSWNKYYTVGAHLTTLGAHLLTWVVIGATNMSSQNVYVSL